FINSDEKPPRLSARFIGPEEEQPHAAKLPLDLFRVIKSNLRAIVRIHSRPNSAGICLKDAIRQRQRDPIGVLRSHPFGLHPGELVTLPKTSAVEDAL